MKANSFVIKDNTDHALESTSRSALGSGIYGIYLRDESEIPSLRTESNQRVYRIDNRYSYLVQDKEHGESITTASLHTNKYIDKAFETAQVDPSTYIEENPIINLVTLWNIVLYRTQEEITKNELERILINYMSRYLSDNALKDTINGNDIETLPINDIMNALGYDGLLADDPYNNGWGRGCVNYNYEQAVIFQGEKAFY